MHKPDQSNTCVVIIDDDEDIRLLLKKKFMDAGYRVGSSKSAEAGMSIVSEMYPDLIIADINLPGMNGIEMLARLKQDYHLKKIPIVMLTGVSKKDTVLKCMQAGAIDYFIKPFKAELLLEKSEKIIQDSINNRNIINTQGPPVLIARNNGVTLFELKIFPDKSTISFFRTLIKGNFKNRVRKDILVFDLRPIANTGPILEKFIEAMIKLFHPMKLKFLVGRHYALLMDLVEDMQDQLYLTKPDFEQSLDVVLPTPNKFQ